MEGIKKVKLSSGFECEVSVDALNDMEILDLLGAVEDNENMAPVYMSRALEKMVGKDARKGIYDSIRTADGRVPVDAFSDIMQELFEELGKKN